MPFKPNYNQRRTERRRAQQQKGEEKQQRREQKAAQRKMARAEAPPAKDPETLELGDIMARKKQPLENGFALFDVIYEDGTRSSNRKVAVAELDALDPDASARAVIETQDRKIAAMSGRSRGPIKAIARSAAR